MDGRRVLGRVYTDGLFSFHSFLKKKIFACRGSWKCVYPLGCFFLLLFFRFLYWCDIALTTSFSVVHVALDTVITELAQAYLTSGSPET